MRAAFMEPVDETQQKLDELTLSNDSNNTNANHQSNMMSTMNNGREQFTRENDKRQFFFKGLLRQHSISYRQEDEEEIISEQIEEHFTRSLVKTRDMMIMQKNDHEHVGYKPKKSWLRQYAAPVEKRQQHQMKNHKKDESGISRDLISPAYSHATSGFFSNSNLSLDSFLEEPNSTGDCLQLSRSSSGLARVRKRAASVTGPTLHSKRPHFS